MMLGNLLKKLNNLNVDSLKTTIGFDGYLDEIIQAVDSRKNINNFDPVQTIQNFGTRILNAAGKSTNIELVTKQWKLGGNGPILGNSLSTLGINVNYVGALGYPDIHPVFQSLNSRFHAKSIDNPGHTMAIEFQDGKIMFGRLAMELLNWESITKHLNKQEIRDFFYNSHLLSMVNWTQTPHMSDIWDKLLKEILPEIERKNKISPFLFIDLADPQKRSKEDILYMLNQLTAFNKYYRVVLGLNEKEACHIGLSLNIDFESDTPENLKNLAASIQTKLQIYCCVIHPVKYAVCAINFETYYHKGPFTPNPKISTGAGDNFNAGFCFGLLNDFSPTESLITGVTNSGFYVRNAKSPSLNELTQYIFDWKNDKI